ncbi:hypothetical protein GRI97_01820 [Altererythrobacter xixiisoli]|uniref:Lipoprotein n=1 Tax=Croceibacterium xixiisoli TaxID=1476466 RepID=A0A6I4TNS3_9SPHN|nr:hypothetical protein [Croceibacterium xixiisoli]MXO97725.1 hypothetical protein [Croceibacterium xixiisoli]
MKIYARSRAVLPFLVGGLLLAAPAAAWACSPAPGYAVPTNLELAGQADTILLAQVTGSTGDPDDPSAAGITIHPIAAIEGSLPDGDISLSGMHLTRESGAPGLLSNPYDFTEAHPSAFSGACIRREFPAGTTVLFFLNLPTNGAWQPAGGPFSRWAEDVPAPDAPWVRLAETYARAARLPDEQRVPMLEAARDALLSQEDDPVAQLMAADITRQLAGPNKPLREALPSVD